MKHAFIFFLVLSIGLACGKPSQETSVPDAGEKTASVGQKKKAWNEEAVAGAQTGPGLAVEAYEVEEGRLKLSRAAERRLGMKVEKLAARDGILRIPVEAVGLEDGEPFVYVREKEGWLKRLFISLGARSGDRLHVPMGLTEDMEVVVQGAALVRLAELDLLAGDSVASCCVY